MEITYTLVGDHYRPNLVAPESPKISRWGMLRFNYLQVQDGTHGSKQKLLAFDSSIAFESCGENQAKDVLSADHIWSGF